MALFHAIYGEGGVGPTPEDLSPVLLWTNPASNPLSPFAAQKVELDLSEYAGVLVETILFDNPTSGTSGSKCYVPKDEKLAALGQYNTDPYAWSRGATCDDTGVTFTNAYHSNEIQNESVQPMKIYGVKKYVVEPVIGELLWTNPSPSTAFPKTDLDLDLSNYDAIKIVVKRDNTDNAEFEAIFDKNEKLNGLVINYTVSTNNYTGFRTIVVSEDKVAIDPCQHTNWNAGSTFAVNNGVCVPYKIYGINYR